MKAKLHKNLLLNGLQLVQNVVGTRSTLPILSNVLIRSSDSQLQLTTTDLDVAVRCTVQAEIAKPGAFTIPVRRFASVIRELPETEIQLEADAKNTVSLRCGASFFKILGLPAGCFHLGMNRRCSGVSEKCGMIRVIWRPWAVLRMRSLS